MDANGAPKFGKKLAHNLHKSIVAPRPIRIKKQLIIGLLPYPNVNHSDIHQIMSCGFANKWIFDGWYLLNNIAYTHKKSFNILYRNYYVVKNTINTRVILFILIHQFNQIIDKHTLLPI